MELKLLLFLCCCYFSVHLTTTKSLYLITVPRILTKNSFGTATISFSSLPSDVDVQIRLKRFDKVFFEHSEKIKQSSTSQIVNIKFWINNGIPNQKYAFEIIGSGGMSFSHSTYLEVRSEADRLFIQTDKPFYKPDEKIRFRVVSIDKDLKPLGSKNLNVVYIESPSRSRMAQWSNVTLDIGMANFELKLSKKPVLGSWKIVAVQGPLREEVTIDVKEYVLAKFKVEVFPPPYILRTDKASPFKICGKYTYGTKVSGELRGQICQRTVARWNVRRLPGSKDPCTLFTKKINGCVDIEYSLPTTAYSRYSSHKLEVSATITEDGTMVKYSTKQKFPILEKKYTMKFQIPKTFRPGSDIEGKLLITTPDGRPAVDDVQVKYGQRSQRGSSSTVIVRNGVHNFTLMTKPDSKKINLIAEEVSNDSSSVASAYALTIAKESSSGQYLDIMNDEIFRVGDTAKIKVVFNSASEKILNYLLICKGKTVVASSKKVTSSSTYLTFSVTDEMIPKCRMLVYYFHGEEFISDHLVVNFALTFKNKVSITFDADEKKPGEEVVLAIKAPPGSKVALSGVDESLMLLENTNDIDENDISSILTQQDVGPPKADPYGGTCFKFAPSRRRRSIIIPGSESLSFKATGLKYFSNAEGLKGRECLLYAMPSTVNSQSRMQQRIGLSLPPKVETRNNFPEVWIWLNETMSSSGEKKITFKVPDTLTTWHVNAFALSPDGIAVSKPSALKAFQPLFISLNLPYSVKRGEIVKVPATVFNYMDKCLSMNLFIAESNDFSLRSPLSHTMCICDNEAKTVMMEISATTLGRIDLTLHARPFGTCGKDVGQVMSVIAGDALTKQLLVEAEGIKKEYTKSIFFCPNDNNGVFKETISLKEPSNLVPGSIHAEIAVAGDLLGLSINGLDKLLAMPHGCGEQNMLKLAPNVFILDYLKASGQSDPEIESKAIKYMTSGYERELTYRHKNGGYSAFGTRDFYPSTWLSAFVLRTYVKAKKHINIDPKEIELTKRFLLNSQNQDGCFKQTGMVHHKEMKGGVTKGVTITAFILIALLEAGVQSDDDRIKKAIGCITTQIDAIKDPYTTAVLAYTLKIAKSDKAIVLLNKLKTEAIRKDGLIHWGKNPFAIADYYNKASSIDIETTAYALMAFTSGNEPFGSRSERLSIVRWLAKQRNSMGGFSSTQDTVVALQALSQSSSLIYSGEFDLVIKATESLPPNREHKVQVTNQNKLVLQKVYLDSPLPFDLGVEAVGRGCALLQVNVKYNERTSKKEDFFALDHEVTPGLNCNHRIKVCSRMAGSSYSNMALLNIEMVSGFEPITEELDKQLGGLRLIGSFTQYEYNEGVLTFYFDTIGFFPSCVEFGVKQVFVVENRRPSQIEVYDYYDKEKKATAEYEIEGCA